VPLVPPTGRFRNALLEDLLFGYVAVVGTDLVVGEGVVVLVEIPRIRRLVHVVIDVEHVGGHGRVVPVVGGVSSELGPPQGGVLLRRGVVGVALRHRDHGERVVGSLLQSRDVLEAFVALRREEVLAGVAETIGGVVIGRGGATFQNLTCSRVDRFSPRSVDGGDGFWGKRGTKIKRKTKHKTKN
jgi:hypothetical protein